MAELNDIAAEIMEHLCTHDWHGYTQGNRWGDGEYETINVCGNNYAIATGDRDCSSAVIDSWRHALVGTEYEGRLDGATYTGNMRSVFVDSGLFEWMPMSYIAQRGDVYLNEQCHTAMCTCSDPDELAEFSISENGTIYGQVGDQTGWESHICNYYDYPWDGILKYVGNVSQTTGWIQQNGKWWYKHSDGSYTTNGWELIDNKWYHFDSEGWMQTGWILVDDKWYYLTDSGAMATDWVQKDGKWYYTDPVNGDMKTGWIQKDGKWYWLSSDGSMLENQVSEINGKFYAFDQNGAMMEGNLTLTTSDDGSIKAEKS